MKSSNSLRASWMGVALAAMFVAFAAPTAMAKSPSVDLDWVTGESPRRLGPGVWEQVFHFTLDADVVAALELDLRWRSTAAVDPTFVAGPAASVAGKLVQGGMTGDRTFKVVVAGFNRAPIPGGELFRVIYHVAPSAGEIGFVPVGGLLVDADGAILDDAAAAVAPIEPTPTSLDPHVDLVLEPTTILPGQTRGQNVRIGSVDNANPAAVQLDIVYDRSALTFKSATIGPAGSFADKTLRSSSVSSSQVRIIVQGYNTKGIPDGDLLTINWQASGSVPLGTPVVLSCGNSIVTDGFGYLLSTTCHGGPVVTVGAMKCDVNLDGRVDVVDVQASINKISNLNGPLVDVNCNGVENVQDTQQITDGALGYDCPTPGANSCS